MRQSLRDDRGQINFVKLFMFAGIVAAAYYAWVYLPPLLDNQGIRQAVRKGCNKAYAQRRPEVVVDTILAGFREAKIENETLGAGGEVVRSPLEVDESNIDVRLLDGPPPSVTAVVTYERTIVLPLLKKQRTLRYRIAHSEDLSEVRY